MAAWNALLGLLAPAADVAVAFAASRLSIVPTVDVDGHVELPSSIPEARPTNEEATATTSAHLDPVGAMTLPGSYIRPTRFLLLAILTTTPTKGAAGKAA